MYLRSQATELSREQVSHHHMVLYTGKTKGVYQIKAVGIDIHCVALPTPKAVISGVSGHTYTSLMIRT